jgi:hypothetical protein
MSGTDKAMKFMGLGNQPNLNGIQFLYDVTTRKKGNEFDVTRRLLNAPYPCGVQSVCDELDPVT